jgi:hypothetical protein
MDGAFASLDNLTQMKARGVADVCFAKKPGLGVLDMVRTQWVYDKLRRFRAGIESGISLLKRVFGLACCVCGRARPAFTPMCGRPSSSPTSCCWRAIALPDYFVALYIMRRSERGSPAKTMSLLTSYLVTPAGDARHSSKRFANTTHLNYFRGQKSPSPNRKRRVSGRTLGIFLVAHTGSIGGDADRNRQLGLVGASFALN